MNFINIPIEVGVFILNYLDLKSKINLYNSCRAVRNYFAPHHLKTVILYKSVNATVITLMEEMLVVLGHHVKDLNLCGIPNLDGELLKANIGNFINLQTLDVTFTEVYLPDIVDICPRYLKNISINFFKCPRKTSEEPTWNKCKELFKTQKFENVHLVVFDLLDSDAPLKFLDDTDNIQLLKITVADNYKDFWDEDYNDEDSDKSEQLSMNFTKLCYMIRDCRVTHKTTSCLKGVANLDFDKIEYIFIMYLEKIVIYVSPIFQSLFLVNCTDFKVVVCNHLPLGFMLDGNIIFKAWNKEKVVFDDNFMDELLMELKDYFPTYVCMHSKVKMRVMNSPSDWYCIDACEYCDSILDELPQKVTLTDFCRKDGVVIRCATPVRFCTGSNTVKNLTFLRLSNIFLREDFFTVLFTECLNLETLDVYVEKRGRLGVFNGYTESLANALNIARVLKNFKMTSEDIEYDVLFNALGRCVSLENIHVCEYERASRDCEVNGDSVRSVITNCPCLYSFFIEADMPPEALTLLMSVVTETAQKLSKDHLCLEVCDCYRGWNPFVDVFNPSPLHILD